MTEQIYSVYILARVAQEIYHRCHSAIPQEMLGRLLGYRLQWEGKSYTKIVDWVSGDLDNSHTHAQFTLHGTRECELFLDERYRNISERPKEIGLFHSHPFGADPHFSSTDYQTFLTFPYNQLGNVFILIDPLSQYFKSFVVEENVETKEKKLRQVPWIIYTPKI